MFCIAEHKHKYEKVSIKRHICHLCQADRSRFREFLGGIQTFVKKTKLYVTVESRQHKNTSQTQIHINMITQMVCITAHKYTTSQIQIRISSCNIPVIGMRRTHMGTAWK